MPEFLPIISEENGNLLVTGKIERRKAHGMQPVAHATATVVVELPDGRILLADRTEKHLKKGRAVEDGKRVVDLLGGHMEYDSIPEEERSNGISLETFRACALRELQEELFAVTKDGQRVVLDVTDTDLQPIGSYHIANDHNEEYSWAFLCHLPDDVSYGSEDTLETEKGMETIPQTVKMFTFEELLTIFDGRHADYIMTDGLGRVLAKERGKQLQNLL